jgi:hypothetical protein
MRGTGEYFSGTGEYFSGVGDDAVIAAPEVTSTAPSWKGPWFFGLFVGVIVGISMGKLLK